MLKLNVLFLSELFYPHGGGAELATYLYAQLLSQKDFNVAVITNKFAGEPPFVKHKKLTIHRLPLFEGSATSKYTLLKRINVLFSSSMKKMAKWADIVYIPRFWYSGILLAKTQHKPVLLHLHDYIATCPLSVLYDSGKGMICECNNLLCSPRCVYTFEKNKGRSATTAFFSSFLNSAFGYCINWLAGMSDAIICVSEAQRRLIVMRKPLLDTKIRVVYNPLPEISYVPLEGDGFAYFGGSSWLKGFPTLYHALEKIIDKKVTVKATNFAQSAENVVQLPNKTRIEKYGTVHGEELKNIYRSIRAVICPSILPEPLPYVIYEALLRGRLVIASNIGGIPEQIDDYPGCFLFSPGDYEGLADLIRYVYSLDRKEVLELGYRNRNGLLKKNQNENSLASFIKIMNDLL